MVGWVWHEKPEKDIRPCLSHAGVAEHQEVRWQKVPLQCSGQSPGAGQVDQVGLNSLHDGAPLVILIDGKMQKTHLICFLVIEKLTEHHKTENIFLLFWKKIHIWANWPKRLIIIVFSALIFWSKTLFPNMLFVCLAAACHPAGFSLGSDGRGLWANNQQH